MSHALFSAYCGVLPHFTSSAIIASTLHRLDSASVRGAASTSASVRHLTQTWVESPVLRFLLSGTFDCGLHGGALRCTQRGFCNGAACKEDSAIASEENNF